MCEAWARQMFSDGVFNADAHAGNILAQGDNADVRLEANVTGTAPGNGGGFPGNGNGGPNDHSQKVLDEFQVASVRREVKARPTEVTADVNAPAARGLAGLPRAAILARRRRSLKNNAFWVELVPPRTIDQLRST